MTIPSVELPTGDSMPAIAAGSVYDDPDRQRHAVELALKAGHRHLDTAEAYGNERTIGEAIRSYDRDAVFLTSKVSPPNLYYDSVIDACRRSLDRLGVEVIDLYLVHWPNPTVSLRETLDAMATLVDRGMVRNVGVSNFDAHLLRVAQHISDVPIALNQVEYHPLYQRPALLERAADTDVVLGAAAPFGRGLAFENDTLTTIAEKYDRSVGQVVLRWEIQRDVVPVPKSANSDHVAANLDVFDWELDADDVRRIDEIGRREKAYAISMDDEVYGIEP
jgi:diketogulonate reductase-like aldo/keto reductase